MSYTITILGSGTSTGVPQIGCQCEVCRSADPKDKRLRASALVTTPRGNRFLIDCGPDFRQQILSAGAPGLDGLLVTHSHYDHVGGIDDLRPYCYPDSFPVWCEPNVAEDLRNRVPYCFAEHLYPGVPTFNIHELTTLDPFEINGDVIVPLRVMHARLPITGFRFGPLAYVTDCKTMPAETVEKLKGVDTLVINALRHDEHMSHMNLRQALDVIKQTAPRRAVLTHISHQMGPHSRMNPQLPPGVELAYDGQTITVD